MSLAVHGLLQIAVLVCFIMVVVKMFQKGQTGLGIATILLAFCGIGFLIAFVYGWVKSGEWQLKNVMLAWTALIVIGIVVGIAMPLQIPGLELPQR